jgi:hypothetical protein
MNVGSAPALAWWRLPHGNVPSIGRASARWPFFGAVLANFSGNKTSRENDSCLERDALPQNHGLVVLRLWTLDS